MKKYLLNFMLAMLISFPLRAEDMSSFMSERSHHNMTEEENRMLLECRGEYIKKEMVISQKIRELRRKMNRCMREEKPDHSDYYKNRELLEELKVLRERTRSDHMGKMISIQSH